jgi:proline racemase
VILSTVEMHTGGEPTRIVVDGWPRFEGGPCSTKGARRRSVSIICAAA